MAPTSKNLRTTIIKNDHTGRPRYTQQYKDEVLEAFESSSMSGPTFAEHYGLKYPTFASWVAKRKKEKSLGDQASAQRFILAEFSAAPSTISGGLHIELPCGASAQLSDASQVDLLASLIKALAR